LSELVDQYSHIFNLHVKVSSNVSLYLAFWCSRKVFQLYWSWVWRRSRTTVHDPESEIKKKLQNNWKFILSQIIKSRET